MAHYMLTHCFPWRIQRRLLVTRLRDIAPQDLAFMINSAPKIVLLASDFHKHLIQVPALAAGSHTLDTSFFYLRGEHWTELLPPTPTSSRLVSTHHSCSRSSTLRKESGKRTEYITARRMNSGLVSKYLNGDCLAIGRDYVAVLLGSRQALLTAPSVVPPVTARMTDIPRLTSSESWLTRRAHLAPMKAGRKIFKLSR